MKLGYVTASFPYGSGESFLAAEIASLARSGVEVVVLPLWPRGPRRGDWTEPAGVRVADGAFLSLGVMGEAMQAAFRDPGATTSASLAALRGPPGIAAKNLAVLPRALWMANRVTESRLDHLHVHWAGTTATAGMTASRISGVPWSLTCHRWDIYEDNLLTVKVASARFTRFISQRGRADAVARGADRARTVVIPIGVEVPPASHLAGARAEGPFTLLCAANFEPVKGHAHLLSAVARLLGDGTELHLLLAGEGPLRSAVERQAVALGIGERVSFLGQVPHREVMSMLASGRVHAVVISSVDLGGGVHEGIPVSLMEAMARGVPVIATRTGSIPELLPDSLGLTVEGGDPEALAACIASLACDPVRRAAAGAACRSVISEGWSIEQSVARMRKLLEGSGTAS